MFANSALRFLPLVLLTVVAGGQTPDGGHTMRTVAGGIYSGDGRPAVSAPLVLPGGLAADRFGALYISDTGAHSIRKILPDGTITTIAGVGLPGFSGDGGPAAVASFSSPYGIAFDASDGLIVADLGNARLRRIDSSGVVTTLAGGGETVAGDSAIPALEAKLDSPRNVATDGRGNLYFSDFYGHRIYLLTSYGMLLRLAGDGSPGAGGDGGPAQQARVSYPAGIALKNEAIYFADSGSQRIRKIDHGTITSLPWYFPQPIGLHAGRTGTLWICDTLGTGASPPVEGVKLAHCVDAADDYLGRVYLSDGSVVWQVAADGARTRVAGNGAPGTYGDGGPAVEAHLRGPVSVAADPSGGYYIAEQQNGRIRYVDAGGVISTFAAGLEGARGVAVDTAGTVAVSDTVNDRVLLYDPSGRLIDASPRQRPDHLVFDARGVLYLAETGAGRISRRQPGGTWETFAEVNAPRGIAVDPEGSVYTISYRQIVRIHADGNRDLITGPGVLVDPAGLSLMPDGTLLAADAGGHQVWRILADGRLQLVAGTGTRGFSAESGAALNVALDSPSAVLYRPGGTILVCDTGNHRVRLLAPGADQIRLRNAASGAAGSLVPGELLTLGIAGSLEVLFDGVSATLVDQRPDSALLLAPSGLAGQPRTRVEIRRDGVSLDVSDYPVAASAPGLYATGSQVFGVHQDGTLNSKDNPAHQGMIVSLFGTGDGGADTWSARFAGVEAEVLYGGPAPGLTGIFQVNARVPGGFLPAGALPVVVTAGGADSPPGVALWVR